MNPRAKCRLAIAITALATYACGDTTTPEPDLAIAHEVPKANFNYPRPEPADITDGLHDRLNRPVRVARSRPATTTTTAPSKSKPKSTAPPPAPTGDVWSRLAMCESTNTNDHDAPYYGYFQFSTRTWQSLGYSGNADEYSYATQLEAAQRLQARSGWGQWPRCARRLGLL